MKAHEEDLVITFDDFTLHPMSKDRNPWDELREYHAEAVQGDVRATIHFRYYSGATYQYQPDRVLYPAGYVMDSHFGRTRESNWGTMGRKQEARAKALLPMLKDRTSSALIAAGWRVVGQSGYNGEVWRYFGAAIGEMEEEMRQRAQQIWRGPYPRQGAEKLAPLDGEERFFRVLPGHLWHKTGDELEILLDPGTRLIHVRRQQRVGDTNERERPAAIQVVEVVGDEEARQRGARPAFKRTRATREVTFPCAWCHATVTQQRYPSPKPMYCSKTCETEAQREKTRERVRRLRARQQNEEASP